MPDDRMIRWRGVTDGAILSPLSRGLRRLSVVAFFGLLAAFLIWWFTDLVLEPFRWPTPRFVFLSGNGTAGDSGTLQFPVMPYADQEKQAWINLATAVDPQNSKDPLIADSENWHGRDDLQSLSDSLKTATAGSRDVLLVYISATGYVEDDTAYLHWEFGSSSPKLDRVRFQEVLSLIADSPAQTKILFLDAGGWPVNTRVHLGIDEFPQVAREELQRIRDPNLWILMSHAEWQLSHISSDWQRTYFGKFLTDGLSGDADFNRDTAIDLEELAIFVRRSVAECVQQVSGGSETQTPILLRAAPMPKYVAEFPILVPSTRPPQAVLAGKTPKNASQVAQPNSTGGTDSAGGSGGTESGTSTTASAPGNNSQAGPAASPSEPTASGTPGTAATPAASAAGTSASDNTAVSSITAAPGAGATPANSAAPPAAAPADSNENPASPTPAAATASGTASAAPSGKTGTASSASGAQPGSGNAGLPGSGAPASPSAGAADGQAGGSLFATQPSGSQLTSPWSQAWTIRDEGLSVPLGKPRIVDQAPHLWREFEIRLTNWEQSTDLKLRQTESLWPQSLEDLTRDVQELQRIIAADTHVPGRFYPRTDLGRRMAKWVDPSPCPVIHPSSLAVLKFVAKMDPARVPPTELELVRGFETAVAAESPEALRKWLLTLPPTALNYYEIRLARQGLDLDVPIPWPLFQSALLTRARGEQLAASHLQQTQWVRQSLIDGDASRLAAERLLLDQVAPERFSRATKLLATARKTYDEAERTGAIVELVMRTRNDVVFRSPDYMRWWYLSTFRRSPNGPSTEELLALFEDISTLCEWIEVGQPKRLEEVELVLRRVTSQANDFERRTQQMPIMTAHFGPQYPGGVRALHILSATAIPQAGVRHALDEIAPALAHSQMRSFQVQLADLTLAVTTPKQPPWVAKAVHDLMRLQTGIGQLAAIEPLQDDPQYQAMLASVRQIEESFHNSDRTDLTPGELLAEYDRFRDVLNRYVWTKASSLAEILREQKQHHHQSDPSTRMRRFAAAFRVLLLARPMDLRDAESTPLSRAIRIVGWYDLLALLRQRYLVASIDAPLAEREYLTSRAESYEVDALAIPGQLAMPLIQPSSIEVSSPSELSLQLQPVGDVPVTLRNASAQTASTWLLVDYDPNLLEIVVPADFQVIHEPRLRDQTRLLQAGFTAESETPTMLAAADWPTAEFRWPYQIETDLFGADRPTLQLTPGGQQTITLTIRRKGTSVAPARVIVKAISANGLNRADLAVEIPAPPPAELLVQGRANSWTMTPHGVELHPFPNRITNYQMQLANRSSLEKQLHVELVAPPAGLPKDADLPVSAIPEAALRNWLATWGTLQPFPHCAVDLKIPANSTVPLAFPKPATNASAPSAPGTPAIPTPPRPLADLDGAALLLMTEPASGTMVVRRIDVTPQHPSRYVDPIVAYNADLQQLTITVQASDPNILPSQPVQVQAEFEEPLAPGSTLRLAGQLTPERPQTVLIADLPAGRQTHRVSLTVDNYPRTFLYDVPTAVSQNSIPPQDNVLQAAILSPVAGTAYPGKTSVVPLSLQVDLPSVISSATNRSLLAGLDLNQNRILDGPDPVVDLPGDRSADVTLLDTASDGTWNLSTSITDLTIPLPLQGFMNGRRNLLVQMTVGERTEWSQVVEIVVDGVAPRIESVATDPPEQVKTGDPVILTVDADDDGLSGVAQVQIGIDVSRTGQFGGKVAAIPATRTESGVWTASVPTAGITPGTYVLLVEAVDAVGNSKIDRSTRLRILTTEQAAAIEAARTGTVSGTVFYGGMPQPKISLTLLKENKAARPVVTTDDQGLFKLLDIPAGTYQLQAQGIVRNKRRTIKMDVVIDPKTNPNQFVRIDLK